MNSKGLGKKYMKKGFFQFLIFTLLLSTKLFASEMKAINFSQKGEISELELIMDNPEVKATRFHVKEDKQILLDLENVHATERVLRAFDTSEFSGGVVFVKAYPKPNSSDIRVAVQLRDNVRSKLMKIGDKVVLQVENRFGAFVQNSGDDGLSYQDKVADISQEEAAKINIPKSESIEDILENLTMSGRKKYIGKKISLNLKNIKPEDILRIIAETSGFNIILTEDAKKSPPLSLNLQEIPWDQALDTVIDLNKLVAKKNGMILIIDTYENERKNLAEKQKAKLESIEQIPQVTKIFSISFADITELEKIVTGYLTPERGKISKDVRTNSLIVKDTDEVIERVKKIVELLDSQTPQVLIESKIVEVSETYKKELGLANGLSFGYDPVGAAGAVPNSGSFKFSSAPGSGDNRSLFGINISRFSRLVDLDFNLKLMESEQKAKVVSSPKVVTKNNVKAEITQNEQIYYPEVTQNLTDGTATTSWRSQQANLSLSVTPQITNEGSISLKVEVVKDSLGAIIANSQPRDETKRKISTEVLVDNGATVVVGGIYTFVTSEGHSGVPFLKDIPLLGWLFRTPYNPQDDKKELIIFLTPRVVNEQEAGLVERS